MINIVIDNAIPGGESLFSQIGQVELIDGRQITAGSIKNADALIIRSITRIDESLLNGSNVSFVASATSGIDHVDLSYLKRRGIRFAYAPGCNARSVAEYVLSACCVLAENKKFKLIDKTVAIIGCGHVGSQVRQFFRTLGMACLVNDPPLRDETGDERYRDLTELLSADIISLHVPLSKDGDYPTVGMIDESFLNRLKDNVILINTSRGQVVDETGLLNYMKRNDRISVVLDVWADEPAINIDLLASVDIGTPHIAGYSRDSKLRATEKVFQQACEYFDVVTEGLNMRASGTTGKKKISLSGSTGEEEAIRSAVLGAYNVQQDHDSCRQLLQEDEERRGRIFDELRNHYPERREFTTMNVDTSRSKNNLRDKLTGLGFGVT